MIQKKNYRQDYFNLHKLLRNLQTNFGEKIGGVDKENIRSQWFNNYKPLEYRLNNKIPDTSSLLTTSEYNYFLIHYFLIQKLEKLRKTY